MQLQQLERMDECIWRVPARGRMRVPAILFGSRALLEDMDEAVLNQVANVAALPGIVHAALAMPDAHWGYGFPIGGVAAFDPAAGGIVSAGGVGFDISCGVRTHLTDYALADLEKKKEKLADCLFHAIPAGVGSTGGVKLDAVRLDQLLREGAAWAVQEGFGTPDDLERIEDCGSSPGADPAQVSSQAKQRQEKEMGTLGSGNHYLEVQVVNEIFQPDLAAAFGLHLGQIAVSIHCGSRGLGHQVATDYAKRMVMAAKKHGIELPDRELACAPLLSDDGRAYLGAMRAAINCALANRQILGHLARQAFAKVFGAGAWPLLYDVSHNTCREELHPVEGVRRALFVHRKGATRAFGPGHPDLPAALQKTGQPVLIGGTMGTASYILAGAPPGGPQAFASACHGAGRKMSRTQATRQWQGRAVVEELGRQHVLIRCASYRGVAEEAPGAYKDVREVVEATQAAGLAQKVARLTPLICVKG